MYEYTIVKIKIKKANEYYSMLNELTYKANNLYNHANFIIRQNFLTKNRKGKFLKSASLTKMYCKAKNNGKIDFCSPYYDLPAKTSVAILRKLEKNWVSFFENCKSKGLQQRPKPPKYKKSGARYSYTFTKQQIKTRDGCAVISPKLLNIKINISTENLQEIEVKPKSDYLLLNAIYRKPVPNKLENEPKIKNCMGIDLGLNNLVAITLSNSDNNYLISGKGLKSKNIYFNYKISKAKQILQKRNKQHTSKSIQRMYEKRQNCMQDYIHKTSKKIVDIAKKHEIDTVIIGHNKYQKLGCKYKHFVQIPIFSIIPILRYKLERNDIHLIEVEESYTSGTSYLDNEKPIKDNYKPQNRKYRGLFITNQGIQINADINASYQIMNKLDIVNNNSIRLNPERIII